MERGLTYTTTITMITEKCCNCGIVFGMPSSLKEELQRDDKKYFYCPNGHSQHYCETKEMKLKKELEAKSKQLQDSDTVKRDLQNKLDDANRKLLRVHNGVCPCCKRNFKNIKRHIENKHPEFIKSSPHA